MLIRLEVRMSGLLSDLPTMTPPKPAKPSVTAREMACRTPCPEAVKSPFAIIGNTSFILWERHTVKWAVIPTNQQSKRQQWCVPNRFDYIIWGLVFQENGEGAALYPLVACSMVMCNAKQCSNTSQWDAYEVCTLTHHRRHHEMPQRQWWPPQWPPGCLACHVGCELRRCPECAASPPILAEWDRKQPFESMIKSLLTVGVTLLWPNSKSAGAEIAGPRE